MISFYRQVKVIDVHICICPRPEVFSKRHQQQPPIENSHDQFVSDTKEYTMISADENGIFQLRLSLLNTDGIRVNKMKEVKKEWAISEEVSINVKGQPMRSRTK